MSYADPKERQLNIVRILSERGVVSAEQLARELKVTARTIRKDIQALSCEYWIVAIPGNKGGYYLNPEGRRKRNYLTKWQVDVLKEVLEEQTDKERKRVLMSIISSFSP